MEGINLKRMLISLLVAGLFGVFCAYGTSTVELPGFDTNMMNALLLTTFYGRLLIGFAIGLAEKVKLLRNKTYNSIVRGALMGAVITPVISFYGGFEIFMAAGILYGILTDLVATKLSS
jgi:hypothetical protein